MAATATAAASRTVPTCWSASATSPAAPLRASGFGMPSVSRSSSPVLNSVPAIEQISAAAASQSAERHRGVSGRPCGNSSGSSTPAPTSQSGVEPLESQPTACRATPMSELTYASVAAPNAYASPMPPSNQPTALAGCRAATSAPAPT